MPTLRQMYEQQRKQQLTSRCPRCEKELTLVEGAPGELVVPKHYGELDHTFPCIGSGLAGKPCTKPLRPS